jgi:hypothetical protein
MRFSRTIKIFLFVIVLLIVIGLAVWTFTSPSPLPIQSETQLRSGLFGYSQNVVSYNISDGTGTYDFKFGLDYSRNLTNGSPAKITVYCALVNQQISSFFTRGVALTLQGSSLSIDGRFVNTETVSPSIDSGLQTYSFVIPTVSAISGNHHSLQVNMVVSTIDVNYIGNVGGTYQSVSLNGTFSVAS